MFSAVSFLVFASAAVSNAQTGDSSCSREDLTKIMNSYFESIQAHKTSGLPLASTVKFTENGVQKDVGKGIWETAGKPLLRRDLIDTKKCVTATIAVIEEPFSTKTVEALQRPVWAAAHPNPLPGALPGRHPSAWRRTQIYSRWNTRRRRRHVWRVGTNTETVRPILFAARQKLKKENLRN